MIKPRYISIQYLRAIAALWVACFHFGLSQGVGFDFGRIGVDIFFVISGFVMWLTLCNPETTAKTFVIHRVIRIVPLYWIMTMALAAAATIKPNLFPLDHPEFYHVIKSLLFIPHASQDSTKPLLSAGWTLNYEMFFYTLLLLTFALSKTKKIIVMTLVMGGLAGAGLVFAPDNVILKTYTSPLLLEFLAGFWLGWSNGLAKIETYMPDIRPLKFLGDASYSIYLTHGFAVPASYILFARLGLHEGIAQFFTMVAIALVIGCCSYAYIERPILSLIKPKKK